MITVSNTSPLTSLAAVGHLDLLHQLYDRVIIPDAVAHELDLVTPELRGRVPYDDLPWIEVRPVADRTHVEILRMELDPGESEAIALAVELDANFLIIDERAGRQVSSRLGVERVGTLGVLIRAKSSRLIPAVKPVLDALIVRAGLWVSDSLYTFILNEADE